MKRRGFSCRWVLLIILALVPVCSLHGAEDPVLVLDGERVHPQGSLSLLPRMAYWVAAVNDLSVEEFIDLYQSGQVEFVRPERNFSFGYSHRDHWFRWTLDAQELEELAELWLQVKPTFLDRIDVYVPRADGRYAQIPLGDHVPMAERPMVSRHFIAPIALSESVPGVYYLRVNTRSTLTLDVRLWHPHHYVSFAAREDVLYGVVFGLILTALLISLASGIWLKHRLYYVAAGYLLCNGLLHFAINGYDQLLLYPNHPWWSDRLLGFSVFATATSVAALTLVYLDLQRYLPWLTRLLSGAAWLALVGALAALLGFYGWLAALASLLAALVLLLSCLATVLMLRHRRQDALLLLVLFVPGFLAMFLQIARNFSLLPLTFWTTHVWALMTIFQAPYTALVVLLRLRSQEQALAVAYRQTREQRQLFGMVAHELRTPLAVVSSALANIDLQTRATHPELAPRFQRANLGLKRLSGLIDNALAEDRLLDTGMQLTYTWVSPRELVTEVGELLMPLETPHQLCLDVDDDLAPVWLDPQWAGLALLNLLDNAIKYSPDGGAIRLWVERRPDACLFNVADQGIGVSPEAAEHLSEKFFRADNARALRQVSGMGIGLFLVRTVMERHGGELRYCAGAKGGSVFSLYFSQSQ